jgi:hypothetical protein
LPTNAKKTLVWVGVPVMAPGFVVALYLKEIPLRTMQQQSADVTSPSESSPAEALNTGL